MSLVEPPVPVHDPALAEAASDLVAQWADEHVDALAIDAAADITPELRAELADLGLMGLTMPEAYGGAGQGLYAACEVVATLARRDRSVATTLGLHLGLGSRGLVAFGSDDLHAATLPEMASGEALGAFAATEPEAGSDLSTLYTKAVIGDDTIRVNGAKVYVTNGAWASVFTVAVSAFTPDGAPLGKALVILRKEDKGVIVGPEEHKLGLRGSSTTSLNLDDVVVPRGRLVGELGAGELHLSHTLAWGRTVMASGCVGTADKAWNLARVHTATRRQFGMTLDQQPVVRQQLVDADALRVAMRALVRWVALGPADEVADRSTAAKVLCSEGAGEVIDVSLQLHGGAGFIEETGVPLLMRDARVTRIFEGANDVLCLHAGTRLLATRKRRVPMAVLHPEDPLAAAADAFAATIDGAVDETLARYGGVRVLRRMDVLHRLGRLAILLESARAVVPFAASADPLTRALAGRWLELARIRATPWTVPVIDLPDLRDPELS